MELICKTQSLKQQQLSAGWDLATVWAHSSRLDLGEDPEHCRRECGPSLSQESKDYFNPQFNFRTSQNKAELWFKSINISQDEKGSESVTHHWNKIFDFTYDLPCLAGYLSALASPPFHSLHFCLFPIHFFIPPLPSFSPLYRDIISALGDKIHNKTQRPVIWYTQV